ncbi:MAG: FDXHR family putative zinc-binding protein [Ktedonobacterales bacterium]
MALGLCEKCAAQAAWGHQTHADKWTDLHPPCAECTPIIATLPVSTPNPRWRRARRGDAAESGTAARDDAGHLTRSPSSLTDAGEGEEAYSSITCGGCDTRWRGLGAAHCSGCHKTFTSVAAFDKHRRGSHANNTRHCVDPESIGLVPARRDWPGWQLPGTWTGPDDE